MAVDELESLRGYIDTVQAFVFNKAQLLEDTLVRHGLSLPAKTSGKRSPQEADKYGIVDGIAKVSQTTLSRFLELCWNKYMRSEVQPGHAVGAAVGECAARRQGWRGQRVVSRVAVRRWRVVAADIVDGTGSVVVVEWGRVASIKRRLVRAHQRCVVVVRRWVLHVPWWMAEIGRRIATRVDVRRGIRHVARVSAMAWLGTE